jgi:hypothetical protein
VSPPESEGAKINGITGSQEPTVAQEAAAEPGGNGAVDPTQGPFEARRSA